MSQLFLGLETDACCSEKNDGGELIAWLEALDDYTLHCPVRKSFPRNPYTMNNIMDVLESDLVDMQGLSKYNDGIKYVLSVIDVFSKYILVMSLKSKTGTSHVSISIRS